jgi:heme/copper-type cytochrome/quinol oxidase subunit 2
MKKIIFFIAVLSYFVGSYFLGNCLIQSFNEPIEDKLVGSVFGGVILIFIIFIIVLIYLIYNNIFNDE